MCKFVWKVKNITQSMNLIIKSISRHTPRLRSSTNSAPLYLEAIRGLPRSVITSFSELWVRNFLSGAGSSTRHLFSECFTSPEHRGTATRTSSIRRIEVVAVVRWWQAALLVALNKIMLRFFKFTRERFNGLLDVSKRGQAQVMDPSSACSCNDITGVFWILM